MAIFQTNIPVVGRGTTPDAGSALNTTGQESGGGLLGGVSGAGFLDTVLGKGKADSFYTDFYNNLLTTANAPPMNSLWLVFIQDMPEARTLQLYRNRDKFGMSEAWYDKAAQEGYRPRGVILAQGVKHVGDGTKFSREGYSNTGMLKGMLSNGRADIEQLDISFLESNLSFVDYALRPWAVAVAHEGLTNPNVKANNITVWHLGKMGAGVNMARRKVITYHNCFPTNIDTQEYNYSGDDINVQRNVTFGFSHYTMEDGDAALLALLSYGNQENKFLSFLKNQVNDAVENVQEQFGANNISQYLNNVVERAKTFGESLVSNTVQGAVTNVSGAIQEAVDGAIRDVTGAGYTAGVDAVGAIAGATNDAIDSLLGTDHNADTVANTSGGSSVSKAGQAVSEKVSSERLSSSGYVEKQINQEDTVEHKQLIAEKLDADPAVVDVNKQINPNDATAFNGSDVTNLAEGGITINRDEPLGDKNGDTPMFLSLGADNLLYYTEKTINQDDTPKFENAVADSIPQGVFKASVQDTADSHIERSETEFVQSNDNSLGDSTIGDEMVEYAEKEINKDDNKPSKSMTFTPKTISHNDSDPTKTAKPVLKTIKKNSSKIGKNITYIEKTIKENDTVVN